MFSYFTGALVLGVVSNPFSLIAVLLLGAVFVVVRWLSVSANREFRRLEALGELKCMFTIFLVNTLYCNNCGLQNSTLLPITSRNLRVDDSHVSPHSIYSARSPIFSHLSATLQGLPVIRSYSMQPVLMDQFHGFQNRNTQAWYLCLVAIR